MLSQVYVDLTRDAALEVADGGEVKVSQMYNFSFFKLIIGL